MDPCTFWSNPCRDPQNGLGWWWSWNQFRQTKSRSQCAPVWSLTRCAWHARRLCADGGATSDSLTCPCGGGAWSPAKSSPPYGYRNPLRPSECLQQWPSPQRYPPQWSTRKHQMFRLQDQRLAHSSHLPSYRDRRQWLQPLARWWYAARWDRR